MQKYTGPHVADGIGHGSPDADGRVVHDDVSKTKHRFGNGFDHVKERSAAIFVEASQGYAKDYGEHCDLENLVLGYRLGEIFRKGVEQNFVPTHGWLRCDGGGRLRDR